MALPHPTPRRRVCIDTNVLLAGALTQRGPSAALRSLASNCEFVVPDGVIGEAIDVLGRHLDPDSLTGATAALDLFLSGLGALEVSGFPVQADDQHVKGAATELDCDAICTYDMDDFISFAVPAWSPRRLFKEIDFFSHSMEAPALGEEGTYLLFLRTWGGDQGRLLREATGNSAIWFQADGTVELTGPRASEWKIHHTLPLGPAAALVVRYGPGRCEVAAWETSTGFPEGTPIGSNGKLLLAQGPVEFDGTPIPGVVPFAECWGATFAPLWLKEHSVRAGIANESLEVAWASQSVEALLSRVEFRLIGDVAVITWH